MRQNMGYREDLFLPVWISRTVCTYNITHLLSFFFARHDTRDATDARRPLSIHLPAVALHTKRRSRINTV